MILTTSYLIFYSVIAVFILLALYTKLTVGRCSCNVHLKGKTALITGGNSGLGYQTALALAGRGCRVIIADRDDCQETKNNIVAITGNDDIVIKRFDLTSFKSIRNLATDIVQSEPKLHILVNNAGVGSVDVKLTEDGLNAGMQINHFGGFLLTHLLSDLLRKSNPSRIVFVSSHMSFFNNLSVGKINSYKGNDVKTITSIYCNSKLCNVVSAKEFSRRLKLYGVTANAVHPGFVSTPIFANSSMSWYLKLLWIGTGHLYAKTPVEGAQTQIHVAISHECAIVTGKYFSDCKQHFAPFKSYDPAFCRSIWEESEKLVKLAPEEKL